MSNVKIEFSEEFAQWLKEGSAKNTPRSPNDPGYRSRCKSITEENGSVVYRSQHPYISGGNIKVR